MNTGQPYLKDSDAKGVLRNVNWQRMNTCLRKEPTMKTNGIKSRIQIKVDKHGRYADPNHKDTTSGEIPEFTREVSCPGMDPMLRKKSTQGGWE